jgi:hypothetical protein
VKRIRTEPHNHGAEGDERIRTAARWLRTDFTYGIQTAELGGYLAGLTDGEGCFVIARTPHAYRCEFIIHLRADDRPLLEWCRELTGLGSIYVGRRVKQGGDQPSVRWSITRRADCLALVSIFERTLLRSKKARDFNLWADAVRCWARKDFGRMGELYLALKATRAFDGEPVEFVVPDSQMEMEVA